MAGSLLGPSAAGAQQTLAASCVNPLAGAALNLESGTRFAQPFVPSVSGALTTAEIGVYESPGVTGDYLVEILTLDGAGTPTDSVLSSATAPDLPDEYQALTATFASPAPVDAGVAYALALSRPGGLAGALGWQIAAESADCPGSLFAQPGGVGNPWSVATSSSIPTFDGRFNVFVTTPSSATPPSSAPPASTTPSPSLGGQVLAPVDAPTCRGRAATIFGTEGNDVRKGTSVRDVIVGLGGNDVLSGLGANDLICGGPGKDTLKGGKGNDKLYAQKGKDTLMGGPGKDKLRGGPEDKKIQ